MNIMCAIIVAFIVGMFFGGGSSTYYWQRDTITRGLAIHCPDDGQWAWLDECEVTP